MNNDVNMDTLIAQMRIMAARAEQMPTAIPLQPSTHANQFKDVLSDAVNKVNELQQSASGIQKRFEQGDNTISLPEVMIASQKSSVAFTAMTEVRNKLVTAYQDIMNMPV